jgi:hypothetical protein
VDRARRAGARQRVRDLRQDLPTILGGLALASAVVVVYAATLGLAFAWGVAQEWSPLAWPPLAALALVLLSLEALFFRDYLRWRRAEAVARRG